MAKIDGNGIAEVEVAPRALERCRPEQLYQPYYLIGAVHIAPCVGSNALWVEQTWGPRASSGQWMSIEPHHGIARIDGAGWVS